MICSYAGCFELTATHHGNVLSQVALLSALELEDVISPVQLLPQLRPLSMGLLGVHSPADQWDETCQ